MELPMVNKSHFTFTVIFFTIAFIRNIPLHFYLNLCLCYYHYHYRYF